MKSFGKRVGFLRTAWFSVFVSTPYYSEAHCRGFVLQESGKIENPVTLEISNLNDWKRRSKRDVETREAEMILKTRLRSIRNSRTNRIADRAAQDLKALF